MPTLLSRDRGRRGTFPAQPQPAFVVRLRHTERERTLFALRSILIEKRNKPMLLRRAMSLRVFVKSPRPPVRDWLVRWG